MRLLLRSPGVACMAFICTVGCSGVATTEGDGPVEVRINPTHVDVGVDATAQLTAVVLDGSGGELAGRPVTWTSETESVATVTSAGLVRGVGVGTALIVAQVAGIRGTASVAVGGGALPPPPAGSLVPELPRVLLDTRYVAPTGRTLTVNAGGSLQAALDSAQGGDVILVQAGATFTGNFRLPAKPAGSAWITVRTSASDASLPPEGTRVTPAHASVMPKIITTNTEAALRTEPYAHHWRLVGLEIAVSSGNPENYGLVLFGDGSGGPDQRQLAQVPSHLIIDRSYLHGNTTGELRRCVALNSASSAVIDSYLTECHDRDQDSQAIMGWNGPGPFKIVNNFLAGAGENVMFGGSDPAIQGLIPSDIEIRRNYFYKPLEWKGVWEVKNLFELKNSQRVLVEGNVFENVWTDGQDGFALLIKSAGTEAWMLTKDVTIRYNRILNAGSGVNVATDDGLTPVSRVLVQHNVLDRLGEAPYDGYGKVFQLLQASDIAFEHNTGFARSHFVNMDGGEKPGVSIRNNIATKGSYGLFGSNSSEGLATIARYLPGGVVTGNVLIGASQSLYPEGNYFPATIGAVGFIDYAGRNYGLGPSSPYKGILGGTDPGADVAAVTAATAGVTVR